MNNSYFIISKPTISKTLPNNYLPPNNGKLDDTIFLDHVLCVVP
jgi:hypothetical protein